MVGHVHHVPGPTATNSFRFPPRCATDVPTGFIVGVKNPSELTMVDVDYGIVITKVETYVSFSITVLLYVSRS
jgi:hypothetical protein